MFHRTALFLASILLAVSAFANPSGRYVALIPINPGTVPGVGGSIWTTSLWVTNTNDTDIPLFCEREATDEPCPLLKAHATTSIPTPTVTVRHQGFFLQVPSSFPQRSLPARCTSSSARPIPPPRRRAPARRFRSCG